MKIFSDIYHYSDNSIISNTINPIKTYIGDINYEQSN